MNLYVHWTEEFNRVKHSPKLINYDFNPFSTIKDIDICFKNMSIYHQNIEIIELTKEQNLDFGKEWLIDTEEYKKLSKGYYEMYTDFEKEYTNYRNNL